MIKNTNNYLMMTFEQIEKSIPDLEKKLQAVKGTHKNAKELQQKMSRLKMNIIKAKTGVPDALQQIMLIGDIREDFATLEIFLQEDEIPYEILMLNAKTSDKIKIFKENAHSFDDKTYWKHLANAYTIQDYSNLSRKLLVELFSAPRKYREELMTKEEQKFLKKLPDEITIYRGGALSEEKSGKYGISWSLDKTIAETFAYKKGITTKKEMKVHQRQIEKHEIIAVFLERKESEIIWF